MLRPALRPEDGAIFTGELNEILEAGRDLFRVIRPDTTSEQSSATRVIDTIRARSLP